MAYRLSFSFGRSLDARMGLTKGHAEPPPTAHAFSMEDPLAKGISQSDSKGPGTPRSPKKGKRFSLDVWDSPYKTGENKELQVEEENTLSAAVACFAKLLIFTFSFVVLGLGVMTCMMGVASQGELANTVNINSFFTDLIPDYMGYTLLSMGLVMVVVAFVGCFSCCCRGNGRKNVLWLLYIFTFGIFLLSICSFLFGMEYRRIITYASTNAFVDSPEGNGPIYRGIKKGFIRAYDKCMPVAYRTDELIEACATKLGSDVALNDDERAALETCQRVDPDKVYLYCRSDENDWQIEEAAKVKHPSWATIKENPSDYRANARQFDWWMSRICMPNTTAFDRAADYATNSSDMGSGSPTAADLTTTEQETAQLFNDCWDSTWFAQDTLEEGRSPYSDPDWFASGGAEPLPVSAKLIFCFCASEPAAQEELWEIVLKYAGYGQWLALAMACFFFLTYLAETYLLCFKREVMEEYLDAASNWESTGHIGGVSHQQTGHSAEVELREGGAAAARNQSQQRLDATTGRAGLMISHQRSAPSTNPSFSEITPAASFDQPPPGFGPPPCGACAQSFEAVGDADPVLVQGSSKGFKF